MNKTQELREVVKTTAENTIESFTARRDSYVSGLQDGSIMKKCELIVLAFDDLYLATCRDVEVYLQTVLSVAEQKSVHQSVSGCITRLKLAGILTVHCREHRPEHKKKVCVWKRTGVSYSAALVASVTDLPQVRCRFPKHIHNLIGELALALGIDTVTRRAELIERLLTEETLRGLFPTPDSTAETV